MLLIFLFSMLLVGTLEAIPLISQPCRGREHEDPTRVLKIILENYSVFNSTIEHVPKTNHNHDIHTFSKKKPVCETESVEVPDLVGKVTIPKKVMEVTLVDSSYANKCKKVKREILYIEEEKNCDQHLDARLYVIKVREIVVAYQHMI
nr:uncharacterized protein LOC124806753 [Hydra vulgaris]